jgi:hypothetical protein
MPGATAGVDMPYPVPAAVPSWPDPAMIARLANGFFQSPPNQPVSSPPSPGVPVAPPSPAMMPAPSVGPTFEARADGPWCATYGFYATRNCGFYSYQQCMAAISGNGGFCSQNRFYGTSRDSRRRNQREN